VRRDRSVDVLVVGGGPAGLATAAELARRGAGQVEVLDREPRAGGIPLFCHHTGFGLRDLHRSLSGPAYAERLVDAAVAAGVHVRPGVGVTGWDGTALLTTSPGGLDRVSAGVVVLATGARERPRSARWIPGDRPAGVLTTGQLQRTVYEHGLPVGSRAVVVGAEHVSFSAVVTLRHAGVRVVAMTTERSRHQSYAAFRVAAAARYRFPLLTGTAVTSVIGRDRVEAVQVQGSDGMTRSIACDTVVLTGSWVAEHELARAAGVPLDPTRTAPLVDTGLRTALPWIVCAGNLAHPVLTADAAALDAHVAAASALRALRLPGRARDAAEPEPVAVVGGGGVARVAPGLVAHDLVAPPRGRVVLWAEVARRRAEVEVRQGGSLLWRSRPVRPLVPDRPYELPAGWVADVGVPGPDVVVSVR
jgi:NADPH-dependent 2,4-dienoyl-CoA reductase/sulfur reductase-like enzyme